MQHIPGRTEHRRPVGPGRVTLSSPDSRTSTWRPMTSNQPPATLQPGGEADAFLFEVFGHSSALSARLDAPSWTGLRDTERRAQTSGVRVREDGDLDGCVELTREQAVGGVRQRSAVEAGASLPANVALRTAPVLWCSLRAREEGAWWERMVRWSAAVAIPGRSPPALRLSSLHRHRGGPLVSRLPPRRAEGAATHPD